MDSYNSGMKQAIMGFVIGIVLAFVIAVIAWPSQPEKFGGTTTSDSLLLKGTLTVNGTSTQLGPVLLSGSSLTATSLTASTITATGTASATQMVASNGLTVAGGKTAILFTSATSSLDFASITNGTCSSTTMTVTGATAGATSPNVVSVGYDPTLKSGYATHTRWGGWVSAANTVTIEGCAGTSTAMVDPPALVFRAAVMNFNP